MDSCREVPYAAIAPGQPLVFCLLPVPELASLASSIIPAAQVQVKTGPPAASLQIAMAGKATPSEMMRRTLALSRMHAHRRTVGRATNGFGNALRSGYEIASGNPG